MRYLFTMLAAALALVCTCPLLWAQATETADGERQVSAIAAPMIPDPDRYPAPAAPATPPPPWRLLQDSRFDATWLPGGTNGLEIGDLEAATTLNIPLAEGTAPLLVTLYAAAHDWVGRPALAAGIAPPDLPSRLYDISAEFAWRPRLAPWLFADLAVTPGLYTDFKDVSVHSFQMRGRAVAIVAFSPQLQLAAGAMYVNRNLTKVLPAGGVIWNPCEDTRCFLVFPQPKVSHRFVTIGATELWGYVAGEFGGGRWEVERASGAADSIDYTDFRAILGVESVHEHGWKGHVEVGYVFARRVNFADGLPDYYPQSTVMLRVGTRY
jgi:hypothetical protein